MVDEGARSGDELITRIAAGDRDAFAQLYRQHRSNVFRFALHMCGAPAVAEDVVHDVFVAVIERASRYRPGLSSVLAWLIGIARNHVKRRRSERPVVPLPENDDDETVDRRALAIDADPLIHLACQRRVAALRRALLDVPLKYREAVVLCDLQELSYAEAAAVLGCAIGTVRSRLHRGRALLAKRLCASGGDVVCRMPAARPIL
jgi:RNA polymerase sigma-70 factor, ECF subfamily